MQRRPLLLLPPQPPLLLPVAAVEQVMWLAAKSSGTVAVGRVRAGLTAGVLLLRLGLRGKKGIYGPGRLHCCLRQLPWGAIAAAVAAWPAAEIGAWTWWVMAACSCTMVDSAVHG